jgi:hypothetical protein
MSIIEKIMSIIARRHTSVHQNRIASSPGDNLERPVIIEMAGAPMTFLGAYALAAIDPIGRRPNNYRLEQQVKMSRTFEILGGAGVKILGIERAERLLCDKTVQDKVALADRLEGFVACARPEISLILSGSDRVAEFVPTHDNLGPRATHIHIEPMSNNDEVAQFVENYVGQLAFSCVAEFGEAGVLDEIMRMTGGHRGLVARLFREAATLAYAYDADGLDPSYLARAFDYWLDRADRA